MPLIAMESSHREEHAATFNNASGRSHGGRHSSRARVSARKGKGGVQVNVDTAKAQAKSTAKDISNVKSPLKEQKKKTSN